MAFDIRAIFSRALGGREDREDVLPVPEPEELTDEDRPESPITAAGAAAASPDTDDMTQGGATASTAMIPEGMAFMPSASMDETSSAREDDSVETAQARLVAEVAVAATMVHGDPPSGTFDDLVETLREVPGLEDLTPRQVRRLIADVRDGVDTEDAGEFVSFLEDRLEEISTTLTDPTLRRAAFQLAVYFCAWDGVLSDEEMDLLTALAEAFEIPGLEARALREATIIDAGVGALDQQRPSAV